jgi:hypothetical protein
MRKTRSDCILLNLPEEQQAQLAEWMLGGMPPHKCKEMLEKEFGVSFRSLSVFKPFYEAVVEPAVIARRARAVQGAARVAESLEKAPGKFGDVIKNQVQQRAFEMLINPNCSAEELMFVVGLAQKAKDQELKEAQLGLARDRFEFDASKRAMEEAAKIKTIAADGALNSDQKIAAVRKVLFGISPQQ